MEVIGIEAKFDRNVDKNWAHKQVENWFKIKEEEVDCCDYKTKAKLEEMRETMRAALLARVEEFQEKLRIKQRKDSKGSFITEKLAGEQEMEMASLQEENIKVDMVTITDSVGQSQEQMTGLGKSIFESVGA